MLRKTRLLLIQIYRDQFKRYRQWEQGTPGRTDIIMRSLQNVVPSQFVDIDLFDFKGLGKLSGG